MEEGDAMTLGVFGSPHGTIASQVMHGGGLVMKSLKMTHFHKDDTAKDDVHNL